MSGAERIDRLKRTSSLAEEGPEDLPFTLQDPLLHASIEALLLRTRETFPQSRANRVVLKQYFKRDHMLNLCHYRLPQVAQSTQDDPASRGPEGLWHRLARGSLP